MSLSRRSLLIGAAPALAAPSGFIEDFSGGMDAWWSEGGERVFASGGRLYVHADPAKGKTGGVATVWRREVQPADYDLELEAHVESSVPRANNINLFLNYTDPSGQPLEAGRASRASAEYGLYHKLNGYIVTFLNDAEAAGGRTPEGETRARIRIRRNPGFQLLSEKFDYHCRAGRTYRLAVKKRGGSIVFSVDGNELLRASDGNPWGAGWFGLRTFRTRLWWDDIRLRPA